MVVSVSLSEESLILHPFIFIVEFFSVALFIFALCIPFEIRDIDLEKARGLRTVPIEYGIRVAKFSGFVALLFCILLQVLLYSGDYISPATLFLLTISYVITMLIILFAEDKPSDLYCKFYVDGLMILQFLLVFLSLKLT